jgi:hypothetical protein
LFCGTKSQDKNLIAVRQALQLRDLRKKRFRRATEKPALAGLCFRERIFEVFANDFSPFYFLLLT